MKMKDCRVYHFGYGFRTRGVDILADSEDTAVAHLVRITGKPELIHRKPKSVREYRPDQDLGRVEVADEVMASQLSAERFPLLAALGPKSISPEWVVDRYTGKVRPAGEFADFPEWILDKSNRPTVDEVQRRGGKVNAGGGLDEQIAILAQAVSWIGEWTGEELRNAILDELDLLQKELYRPTSPEAWADPGV
jgi:hypothetical protein